MDNLLNNFDMCSDIAIFRICICINTDDSSIYIMDICRINKLNYDNKNKQKQDIML